MWHTSKHVLFEMGETQRVLFVNWEIVFIFRVLKYDGLQINESFYDRVGVRADMNPVMFHIMYIAK